MRVSATAALGVGGLGGFLLGFQTASTIYSTEAERESVKKAVKLVSAGFGVALAVAAVVRMKS